MFKSLYGKYLATFAAIILTSFLVLGLVISPLLNSYLLNAKKGAMERISEASVDYFYREYREDGYHSLDDYLANHPKQLDVIPMLMSANEDEYFVFITDTEGKILLVSKNVDTDFFIRDKVSDDIMFSLLAGVGDRYVRIDDTLTKSDCIVCASPLSPNGNVIGVLFVCSQTNALITFHSSIVQTIISAAGWILLASLVLVYITTDKISSPLKAISRASKSFAAGNFDTRIPITRGCDEITELAVSFNQMAESLQTMENTRRSFLANVSHDMRTPMTTISGFIDGILDGTIPEEKQAYYLQLVSSEVKRLSRLVTQLLDLSRIQAGERKFVMMRFNICEMARLILLSFEQRIDEKKMNVNFICDEEDMFVSADEDAIHQVLYNLIDNAVKFSPAEGGELRLILKKESHRIRVIVYNKGQGIRPEDVPFVFDRFYKEDKSRGLDKNGVGLGLYISKTIMDAHHQQLKVESVYGKYCQFTMTLARDDKRL